MLDFNEPSAKETAATARRKGEITRALKRSVLARHRIDRLPKVGERTLVTGGQGTGKTRTVIDTIAEMECGASIWFLAPTLEKAEETAAEYKAVAGRASLQAYVVRGRGAPDPRTTDDAMCPRHGVVNRAAAASVKVRAAICDNGCPRRFSCGFMRQAFRLKGVTDGLFLMAADYLWLPCPAPRPDYAIVDESVVAKAVENISLDPGRITDDDKWAVPGDLDRAIAMRHTALLVRAAVTEHPGRELAFLRSHDVQLAALRRCAKHLRTKEEARPAVAGQMSDHAIAAALDAAAAREILNVYKLFRAIVFEYDQPRTRLNSVWFDPNHTHQVAGQVERQPRVFVSAVRKLRLRKNTPVLMLDGTGSLELNRKIFGEHTTGHRFAVPRDAVVYQVTGKTFSRQSITGADRHGKPISEQKAREAVRLRQQVVEFLTMLPGKVLLVSYKPAIEVLREGLPAHVMTAHFGALRGLNSFSHCETVVVMGRQQPPAAAVEALARPFTATDAEPFLPVGEYAWQCRGRRMRDPEAANVTQAQVHPDTRCQAMLEQVREAEMVQAVDRVRPVFNHRRVFVLSDLSLDLTVDHAMTWSGLRPSKLAHAFARYGVLPLAPADLCRGFPDLWHLENTAKVELGRAGFGSPENRVQTPKYISIWSLYPVLRGTYRRKGQRGPLSNLLVRSDLPDPRAVLEGMVGELNEFHVERPPDPASDTKPNPEAASPKPRPVLPPLAAALSAEAHLLGTMPPDMCPPEMLGMAGIMRLMKLQRMHTEPEEAMAA
jgi:hypothetical protein